MSEREREGKRKKTGTTCFWIPINLLSPCLHCTCLCTLCMHVFVYFVGSLRVPMCFVVVVAHEASAMPFGCFIWIWAVFFMFLFETCHFCT